MSSSQSIDTADWRRYTLQTTCTIVWNVPNSLTAKGVCDCPRCLSVCLLARLLKKHAHGFGWNFACRQVSGHGRTDQLLSPNHSPDAETGKSEIESRSNRHITQSRLQVTGCTVERYCLLHVVVQGPVTLKVTLQWRGTYFVVWRKSITVVSYTLRQSRIQCYN